MADKQVVKERVVEVEVVVGEKEPCKTADEMEEICCHAHAELPCCKEVEGWDGYTVDDVIEALGHELDDKGRNADGEYVEIVFAPRGKPCGLKETVFDTSAGSCCDEVSPLKVDHENSVEVMVDSSIGMLYITGGRLPFRVQVFGTGFYVSGEDGLYVDAVVDGRSFIVRTTDACGTGYFVISDGCSQVTATVRSVAGRWSEEFDSPPNSRAELVPAKILIQGVEGEYLGFDGGMYREIVATVGGIQQRVNFWKVAGGSAVAACYNEDRVVVYGDELTHHQTGINYYAVTDYTQIYTNMPYAQLTFETTTGGEFCSSWAIVGVSHRYWEC